MIDLLRQVKNYKENTEGAAKAMVLERRSSRIAHLGAGGLPTSAQLQQLQNQHIGIPSTAPTQLSPVHRTNSNLSNSRFIFSI